MADTSIVNGTIYKPIYSWEGTTLYVWYVLWSSNHQSIKAFDESLIFWWRATTCSITRDQLWKTDWQSHSPSMPSQKTWLGIGSYCLIMDQINIPSTLLGSPWMFHSYGCHGMELINLPLISVRNKLLCHSIVEFPVHRRWSSQRKPLIKWSNQ